MFAAVKRSSSCLSRDAIEITEAATLWFEGSLHDPVSVPEGFPKHCKDKLLPGEKDSGRKRYKRKRTDFESPEDAKAVLDKQRTKLQKRYDNHYLRMIATPQSQGVNPSLAKRKPQLTPRFIPLPSQLKTLSPSLSTPQLTTTPPLPPKREATLTPPPASTKERTTTPPQHSAPEGTPTPPKSPTVKRPLTPPLPPLFNNTDSQLLPSPPEESSTSMKDQVTAASVPDAMHSQSQKTSKKQPGKGGIKEAARKASTQKLLERYATRIAKLRQDRLSVKRFAKFYHKAQHYHDCKEEKRSFLKLRRKMLVQKSNSLVVQQKDAWEHELRKRFATVVGSSRMPGLRLAYEDVQDDIARVDMAKAKCHKEYEESHNRLRPLEKAVWRAHKKNGDLICEVNSSFL